MASKISTPASSVSPASPRPPPPTAPRFIEFGDPEWKPDEEAQECNICARSFGMFTRRHHCRLCGTIVCGRCSAQKIRTVTKEKKRVCSSCWRRNSRASFSSVSSRGSFSSPQASPILRRKTFASSASSLRGRGSSASPPILRRKTVASTSLTGMTDLAKSVPESKVAVEKAEAERKAKDAAEKAEAERVAKEAAEKAEAERIAKEAAEKAEAERKAKEAAEKAEAERIVEQAAEKAEAEQIAKEAAEKAEAERIVKQEEKKAEADAEPVYLSPRVSLKHRTLTSFMTTCPIINAIFSAHNEIDPESFANFKFTSEFLKYLGMS